LSQRKITAQRKYQQEVRKAKIAFLTNYIAELKQWIENQHFSDFMTINLSSEEEQEPVNLDDLYLEDAVLKTSDLLTEEQFKSLLDYC
jgi:hypothetical protein